MKKRKFLFYIALCFILPCLFIFNGCSCSETDFTQAFVYSLDKNGVVTVAEPTDFVIEERMERFRGTAYRFILVGTTYRDIYLKHDSGYVVKDDCYQITLDLKDLTDNYIVGETYRLSFSRQTTAYSYANTTVGSDVLANGSFVFTVNESGEFVYLEDYYMNKIASLDTVIPLEKTFVKNAESFGSNYFIATTTDGKKIEIPFVEDFYKTFKTDTVGSFTASYTFAGVEFKHNYNVVDYTAEIDRDKATAVITSISNTNVDELTLLTTIKAEEAHLEDNKVVGITQSVLDGFSSVKKLSVPFDLGVGALANFQSLEELTITAGGAKLLELFNGNIPASLKTVKIYKSSTIPAYFFHNAGMVTKLITTSAVQNAENNALSGLTSVTDAVVSGGFPLTDLVSLKNVAISFDGETLCDYFLNAHQNVESIFMPCTVKHIEYSALYNCPKLTNVDFSYNIKTLGNNSLGYSKLDKVYLPNTETVGVSAFLGSAASEIEFGKRVNKIENAAFRNCANLKTLKIPSPTVSFEKDGMLQGLTVETLWIGGNQSIQYIYGKPGNGQTQADINFALKNLKVYGNICEKFAEEMDYGSTFNIAFDDSVKVIGPYAFEDNQMITSIDLNKVEEVKASAFHICYKLATITAGDSFKVSHADAFFGSKFFSDNKQLVRVGNCLVRQECDTDGNIVIPNGVKYIGYAAIRSNTENGIDEDDLIYATNVVIPASVVLIDESAFVYASRVTSVTIQGRPEIYEDSVIDDLVYIFGSCDSLTQIKVNLMDLSWFREAKFWNRYANLYAPI